MFWQHPNNRHNIYKFLTHFENQKKIKENEQKYTIISDSNNYIEFEKGKDSIKMNTTTIKQNPPYFNGYCYYCDCPKHSQNYCPLRQCSICNTYGHSVKVCPKNTASGSENWREKEG